MDFHLILLPIVSRQIHRIGTRCSLTLPSHDLLHLTAVLHQLDACYLSLNLLQNLASASISLRGDSRNDSGVLCNF
jgi:hypothetical protein